MAERSNASSKKSQEAAQDVTTLQKRGRRRLVGAIALVLLAVIVLPMVFDPEPRPNAPLVNVRIPSEDGSKFTPKAATKPAEPEPRPAEKKAEDKAPEPSPPVAEPARAAEAPAPKPVPKPFEKIVTKAMDKPAEKPVEKKAAEKPVERPADKPIAKAPEKAAPVPPPVAPVPAAPAGEKFMVQVGAFASPDKVKEITGQLKDAKLPHYTETVATAKGEVTRVRLGPFNSKEAAEKARDRAKALGLSPANPVAK